MLPTADPDTPGALPRTPPVVWGLIAANVAVAFLQLTLLAPATVRSALGFQMSDLDGRWWSIGTYMFVHAGFWHLALNMWMLWLFGPRVAATQRPAQFLGYYLLCGVGGWFAHLLFAPQGLLIGASAAVMGVLVAFAMRWPEERVALFGVLPMTVRWLVALLVLFNLLGGMSAETGVGGVAYLAHLGGLVTGWAATRVSGVVALDGLRPRVDPVADEPEDITTRTVPHRYPRPRPEAREPRAEVDEIVAQSRAALSAQQEPRRSVMAPPPPPTPTAQQELNRVLDKISAQGMDALTRAERQVLEDAARRLREG
jgi:membrane associated rhomboid family serine protease